MPSQPYVLSFNVQNMTEVLGIGSTITSFYPNTEETKRKIYVWYIQLILHEKNNCQQKTIIYKDRYQI